ncbi:MAG TPA: PKD domain-containing protein [Thermoanaerobaculia bacterium]|nr:PKD domain-containing protein [Thermoanaerobaculia bacterium]
MFPRQPNPRSSCVRSRVAAGLFAFVFAVLLAGSAQALEFYASPSGSSSGDGSISRPWDLRTALKQPSALKPGDVLWLRGGKYYGPFVSYLTGTSSAPITVRQYPGERATLDGVNAGGQTILQVSGAYTRYWGFEIMSSQTNRSSSSVSGAAITTMQTPGHPGLKLINLVIHDTLGNGFWIDATDMEMYGCLVYYNGWAASDRGHGHGIYAQNDTGTKHFIDNIIFQQFDKGIQYFGGTSAPINNMDTEGNTLFQNGYIDATESNNIEIGGGVVAQNPVFKNNYSYNSNIGKEDIGGYNTAGTSNLVYQNNYDAADNDWPTTFSGLNGYAITGNLFRGHAGAFPTSAYPSNSYYLGTPPPATPNQVFVRPNKYEPGRANITAFNWAHRAYVYPDVSAVLAVGDAYEVRNAQNFYGPPVATGTYAGGRIAVPTTGLPSAAPVGWATPAATGPEFNAYVFLRKSGSPTPTSTGSAPDPHFSIQPNPAPVGTSVQFVDTSLNQPTSWSWAFGDGGSSTWKSPKHIFKTRGTFTVRLTVKNASGSASTTNTISVY